MSPDSSRHCGHASRRSRLVMMPTGNFLESTTMTRCTRLWTINRATKPARVLEITVMVLSFLKVFDTLRTDSWSSAARPPLTKQPQETGGRMTTAACDQRRFRSVLETCDASGLRCRLPARWIVHFPGKSAPTCEWFSRRHPSVGQLARWLRRMPPAAATCTSALESFNNFAKPSKARGEREPSAPRVRT
jgi:hypothetical protein